MSHIHIDVKKLSFGYEADRPVLNDITLHLGEHESVGLIGANGTGKSSLLKLLVGLFFNFTGSISVEEIPLIKSTADKIREKIGYVFQDSDSQLFMTSVGEDVAFAPRNYGLPEEEVLKRVDEALARVKIPHLKERSIYRLSGGEKKLVSIATVLSMTPDILLFDEPTVGLDPQNRRNLINIVNDFHHLKLIASHDLDFILDTCDRVLLLYDGRIIKDGRAEIILHDRILLENHGLELPLSVMGR